MMRFGVKPTAGVGSTSHRHGFLATQVAYAQVVLGTGDGWLARRDPAFWRTHYGTSYPRMALLKRLFDPANILASAAGPLRLQ